MIHFAALALLLPTAAIGCEQHYVAMGQGAEFSGESQEYSIAVGAGERVHLSSFNDYPLPYARVQPEYSNERGTCVWVGEPSGRFSEFGCAELAPDFDPLWNSIRLRAEIPTQVYDSETVEFVAASTLSVDLTWKPDGQETSRTIAETGREAADPPPSQACLQLKLSMWNERPSKVGGTIQASFESIEIQHESGRVFRYAGESSNAYFGPSNTEDYFSCLFGPGH